MGGVVPVVSSSWFVVIVLLVVVSGFTMDEGSLSKLGWPCIEVSLSVSEREKGGVFVAVSVLQTTMRVGAIRGASGGGVSCCALGVDSSVGGA